MKTYAQTVITCVAVGTLSPLTAYRTLPRIVLFPVHSFSIRFRFHKKYFASPAPQASARRNASKLLPANAATPPLPAAHAGLLPVAPIPSRPSASLRRSPSFFCTASYGLAAPPLSVPAPSQPQLHAGPALPSHPFLPGPLSALPGRIFPTPCRRFQPPAPQLSARRNAYKLLPTNAATPPLPAFRPTAALSGTPEDRAGKRTPPSSIPPDRPEKFLPQCSAPDSGTLFPELFIVFFSQQNE